MEQTGDKTVVPALERALDILELLEASPSPLTWTEIVERLNLPKASAHRLLSTLMARGYVTQENSARRGFLPGVRLAVLGARFAARMDLTQVARPLLELLAQKTGEGCQLSIRAGDQAICILRVPSPLHPEIALAGIVGTTFPLHAVAVGKAMLAFATEDERKAYLGGPLSALTPHTHTDRAMLSQELDQIRERGYAYDDEEYKPGLCAFAVPVFDSEDRARAAIALPFLKAGGIPADTYLTALQATAAEISAALGAGHRRNNT